MEAGRAGKKKKMLAVLVGCNYGGTEYELQGCINDVHAMRAVLLDRFGFEPGDVTVLTDDDGRGAGVVLPTGANVKRALADMVACAAPGDVLFFHFSGHGTLVPPVGGRTHRHRHGDRDDDDEAIVPCDFNLITDVDFRQLVDRVPAGATFTMVSDSCHSGGLIDQEKEQIGPTATATAGATRAGGRFLPYAAVLGHLSGASGVAASHHVADHLVALFGADASAKFHRRDRDRDGGAARTDDDAGILLSGCQTDETSADVAADDDDAAAGGRACGAFSSALQAVLAAHRAPMSNREVVRRAREVLGEQGFQQHPCLYCSDANADAPFLGQQETKSNSARRKPPPPAMPTPTPPAICIYTSRNTRHHDHHAKPN